MVLINALLALLGVPFFLPPAVAACDDGEEENEEDLDLELRLGLPWDGMNPNLPPQEADPALGPDQDPIQQQEIDYIATRLNLYGASRQDPALIYQRATEIYQAADPIHSKDLDGRGFWPASGGQFVRQGNGGNTPFRPCKEILKDLRAHGRECPHSPIFRRIKSHWDLLVGAPMDHP